ncbi:MAG: undecaprenyl-diphosphate phosphatase [Epulopiscium sp.]|nr:undecaprenyl-diphosphate phosphatase [Candidatus Epulonipiscium sp.]
MSILKAIIMGIVQGMTEFLPVSSSGHLVIFGKLLRLELNTGIVFEVMLHLGTLIAIFCAYTKDVWSLIKAGIGILIDIPKAIKTRIQEGHWTNKEDNRKKDPYRKLVWLIIVASIPTAIIAFTMKPMIEYLFSSLLGTGIALLVTGCLLYIADKIIQGTVQLEELKYKNAFVIGIIQGFATIPGISRSGSTIVAGLLNDLDKESAIRFSFLMSIPAVLGAGLLELKDVPTEMVSEVFSAPYLIGTAVAAISGFICIKALIVILKNQKLHWFSYYCWIIGLLAIISHWVI